MNEEYGHISDAFDILPEEELFMTEAQQEWCLLYETISNWWDETFTEPTKGRSACIVDLVNSIIESKNNDTL